MLPKKCEEGLQGLYVRGFLAQVQHVHRVQDGARCTCLKGMEFIKKQMKK
jgi:hypothetical protein